MESDNDFCGGNSSVFLLLIPPTGIYLGAQDYPGVLGPSIGYKKIQHADIVSAGVLMTRITRFFIPGNWEFQ
jgi:hypothetical protein